MTTDTKHTPTPWGLCDDREDGSVSIVAGENGVTVGSGEAIDLGADAASDNAAFIVRACNAHDALVAALREIFDIAQGPAATRNELAHAVRESARAALALAEGKR